jgi:hypothetical protein
MFIENNVREKTSFYLNKLVKKNQERYEKSFQIFNKILF